MSGRRPVKNDVARRYAEHRRHRPNKIHILPPRHAASIYHTYILPLRVAASIFNTYILLLRVAASIYSTYILLLRVAASIYHSYILLLRHAAVLSLIILLHWPDGEEMLNKKTSRCMVFNHIFIFLTLENQTCGFHQSLSTL